MPQQLHRPVRRYRVDHRGGVLDEPFDAVGGA
jgi:hypothetical protein